MREFVYRVTNPAVYEIVNLPHLVAKRNWGVCSAHFRASEVVEKQQLVDSAALTIVHAKFSRFNHQMPLSEDDPFEEVDPMMYIGYQRSADLDLLDKALTNELSDYKLVAVCCYGHGFQLEYLPVHDDSGLEPLHLSSSSDLRTEIRIKDASGNIFDLCHWPSYWGNVKDYFQKGKYYQADLHTVILESDRSGQIQRRVIYNIRRKGGLGFWSQLWARYAGRKQDCICTVAEYKS